MIWILFTKYFWCWLLCQFASEQGWQFFCPECVQCFFLQSQAAMSTCQGHSPDNVELNKQRQENWCGACITGERQGCRTMCRRPISRDFPKGLVHYQRILPAIHTSRRHFSPRHTSWQVLFSQAIFSAFLDCVHQTDMVAPPSLLMPLDSRRFSGSIIFPDEWRSIYLH